MKKIILFCLLSFTISTSLTTQAAENAELAEESSPETVSAQKKDAASEVDLKDQVEAELKTAPVTVTDSEDDEDDEFFDDEDDEDEDFDFDDDEEDFDDDDFDDEDDDE